MPASENRPSEGGVSGENKPSERVVWALAAQTGTDPLELPPLYEVVDTDALDALFAGAFEGSVQFVYDGHEVVVDSDGGVDVVETSGSRGRTDGRGTGTHV